MDASTLAVVSAYGSAAVAVLTLIYVIVTARTLRHAQRTEDARATRERSAQASSLSAWVSQQEVRNSAAMLKICIRNSSEQAVYGIQAQVWSLNLTKASLGSVEFEHTTIAPQSSNEYEVTLRNLPDGATGDLRVSMDFIDGAGARWQRDQWGNLSVVA